MADYIVRASAAGAQIRAFGATTRELAEAARKAHDTSPVVTAALGRLMTGGVMMGAMLKGEKDLLTLQVSGDGPVKGMTVTADSQGNVKGYAIEPQVMLPPSLAGKLDVGGAVGSGMLLYFRKKKKTVYPVVFTIFMLSVLIKWPLMNALHVTQPDLVESLSIPIQQVAAVLCNDRALTDEELELIENVVDLTYIKDLYVPFFADNMKELVRAGHPEYLEDHKQEFLKLWAALGLRYPGDYLTAYIRQTYGYWYPDSFYLVAEAEGVSATSLGVSHTPLIRGPLVIKLKEISIKLGSMIPLYGTLWSMGVICWVLIFSIGCAFVRKELPKLILYLPSAALLLTVLIATPVATEFRYVYFMVFSFPFYLMTSMLILPREEDSGAL